MQVAVDVAGFSAADADELRRAMGAKRSEREDGTAAGAVLRGDGGQRHHRRAGREHLREDAGVRELRLPGEPLDQLRVAGLLQLLVQAVLPGGVLRGAAQLAADGLLLTAVAGGRRPSARRARPRPGRQPGPLGRDPRDATRGSTGGWAVRLGLADVRSIGIDLADGIDAERERGGAFRDLRRLRPPHPAHRPQVEALATAGAFGCFGVDRRSALWAAGVVASVRPEQLPGSAVGTGRARAARAHRRRAHRRRRVGHRRLARQPSDAAPAGEARPARRVRVDRLDAVGVAAESSRRACSSAAWSPTGSGPRPRAASRS